MAENTDIAVVVAGLRAEVEHLNTRVSQIEEQQDAIQSLATSVAVFAEKQERMQEDLGETRGDIKEIKAAVASMASAKDVEELKMKPAKRWDSIVEYIILALVAAALGVFMGKLGL